MKGPPSGRIPEYLAENILPPSSVPEAKLIENTSEIKAFEDVFLAVPVLEPFCPEHVILFFLLGVTQNGIGLADILELGFGLFIVFIAVRMILQCQFSIGLLDIFGRSGLLYTQYLIIIFAGHSYTGYLYSRILISYKLITLNGKSRITSTYTMG
jgi:hypothetical protein